jgi:type I restriction enzyme M protein
MEVLEQITYLLFVRCLDDAHTLAENMALIPGKALCRELMSDTRPRSTRT